MTQEITQFLAEQIGADSVAGYERFVASRQVPQGEPYKGFFLQKTDSGWEITNRLGKSYGVFTTLEEAIDQIESKN